MARRSPRHRIIETCRQLLLMAWRAAWPGFDLADRSASMRLSLHIFYRHLQTARALQLRLMELFVPMINMRREYKRFVKEEG
ncbi:cytochrome P450 89A2-like [Panicum miliaceum]|uniref:Cytochrome P450 89A2-like n=1 Tax=Panicum miliaceum TaxID=4540 RepID=A0A3L6SIM3_PANMI|nr:cytochrome P450 89A2-like [Panicum miliaceum]